MERITTGINVAVYCTTLALFVSLIIRTFQFVFSAGTLFFSHNKSAGTLFRLVFSAKICVCYDCWRIDVDRFVLILAGSAFKDFVSSLLKCLKFNKSFIYKKNCSRRQRTVLCYGSHTFIQCNV